MGMIEMTVDYKELVAQSYQAMAEGRIADFKAYFADQLVWKEAEGFPYGGVYHGIDAVVDHVHSRLGSEWMDYQATPKAYFVSENQVVVHGQYSGTYKKTNKFFRADFAHFYRFDEAGKVVNFIQVVDSALVQAAMTL
ncbi:Ketosteroid isomerase-related protein [Streptococcus sp. DD10]|uniref:nuclear transport factor 2 family protein n=1 Tax=Streptococcus sp. DD10 TaxID=1777878 RepID=UPI000795838A|nr:nuclear transport factor 2 family protein [Streptococcus sp. DD10]KXT72336.1 Ketosteroid isomerase-related protein [Streptococcus sp. DD10]